MKLEDMKVPELKEKAKSLNIEGADGMKKAELVDAISKAAPEGMFSKIVKAVDKALHGKPSEEQDQAPDDEEKSSCQNSDLEKHPKFAKFKSQGEKQP